ncbi:hypothetical protein AB1Y20_000269 [Prymnesium parvum]|uniref:Uncharacterized protein n=1 Tax=Prymnesium parvum TaxID=97485 RepID=A0AB34K9L6_PRYPA
MADAAVGDMAVEEEDSTPHWLQSAVDRLADVIVRERHASPAAATPLSPSADDDRPPSHSPPPHGCRATAATQASPKTIALPDTPPATPEQHAARPRRAADCSVCRWAALVLATPLLLAISIPAGERVYHRLQFGGWRTADGRRSWESAGDAHPAAATTAVAVPGGTSADQMVGAISLLGHTLRDALQRGDGAVLAASREAAAREAAQTRLAELEEEARELRREMSTMKVRMRELEGAVLTKEEALARLEDMHSLTRGQLEKDAKCCRMETRGHGQAMEARKQAEGKLYRCERQLQRALEHPASSARQKRHFQWADPVRQLFERHPRFQE